MICLTNAFIYGFSRVLDIFGTMHKEYDCSDGIAKDLEALKGDWEKVGETIYKETIGYKASGQNY